MARTVATAPSLTLDERPRTRAIPDVLEPETVAGALVRVDDAKVVVGFGVAVEEDAERRTEDSITRTRRCSRRRKRLHRLAAATQTNPDSRRLVVVSAVDHARQSDAAR
jgi:hypothetical protein